jgi:uroporphyrinogen-III synthase
VVHYLNKEKIKFQEAMMYRTVASDLSDLADITYDVLVFFSPLGIESLYRNFPDFKQNDTRIAVYGNSTSKAVEDRGLEINIKAPQPETPSMTMALEKYIVEANGKK